MTRMIQTYDNYYRAYYLKNRKKILARTKAYRKKYSKDYYFRKKAEAIAAEKTCRARTDDSAQEGLQVSSSNPANGS